jgi:hypothetical protein
MKYHNKLTKKYVENQKKYNKKTRRNFIKNYKNDRRKFNTNICDDKMTYADCELAILRQSVDESEIIKG